MNTISNVGNPEEYHTASIFTCRQLKVIELSCELKTNQEIAALLNIAEVTVKTHRKNIMKKVGISGKSAMNKFIMTLKFH